MDFSEFDTPIPNSQLIKWIRLPRFEAELKELGVSFAYADDTMLEAGLVVGGEKGVYEQYALEVYNLCKSDLALANHDLYERFLKLVPYINDPRKFNGEYHYKGEGTYDDFQNSPKKKQMLTELGDFAYHFGTYVFDAFGIPYGFISYVWNKDFYRLRLSYTDFNTEKNCLSEEIIFYLLVKTDEIMSSYGFYLK